MPDNRDKTIYKLYAWKGQTRRQLRTTGPRWRVARLQYAPRIMRTLRAMGYEDLELRQEAVHHV